ncbi:MAG: hypothetical protein WEG56_08415 [Chloroflexota bacterium]
MDAQAGLPCPPADGVEDLIAGQGTSCSSDPEWSLLGAWCLWVPEVAHQRPRGRVAVDDGSAATALRRRRLDKGQTLAEVEVAEPQGGELAAQDADGGRRVAALAERHEEGLEVLAADRAQGARHVALDEDGVEPIEGPQIGADRPLGLASLRR